MEDKLVATFIGHSDCYGVNTQQVKKAIIDLINRGVTVFLSGGQGRFDKMCARCVAEIKKEYTKIENILVIPYLTFRVFNKDIFDYILYPENFEKYNFKAAIPARNKYLVDNSQFAICYITHGWGGAAATYRKALRRNLKIINLGNDNF